MGNKCVCLKKSQEEPPQEHKKRKNSKKSIKKKKEKKGIKCARLKSKHSGNEKNTKNKSRKKKKEAANKSIISPNPNNQEVVEEEEEEEEERIPKTREYQNPAYDDNFTIPVPSRVLLHNPAPALSHLSLTDRYSLRHELGRGEFGITRLCIDKETRESFACKSIPKGKLLTAVDVEDVRREVSIMSSLPSHPNVVRLRSAHEDPSAVHLVMELCEGGELFGRIVARGRYGERDAAGVVRIVAEVVKMCHDNGVIHRDLKPENFLFASGEEDSPLKVIDFGLSVFFRPGERFSEVVGSPYYMAPEVLKQNYGPEIDVWSAGVILYILLSGVLPFSAETEQGVAQAILRGEINFERDPWPRISEDAKSLLRQMLEPDPKRRLTAQGVLEHPWLQHAKRAPDVPSGTGSMVQSRIKQFSPVNGFKKKALRVIAEYLSAEEVQAIRDQFKLMDPDDSGKISFEELKAAGLRKFGSQLGDTEMKMLMEAIDADGNGVLNYREFVDVSIRLEKLENEGHLRRAFTFFDQDGSGYIEIYELRDALKADTGEMDAEVLTDILQEVDTDKDGRISFEEFATMMKAGTGLRKASRQYGGIQMPDLN